MRVLLSKNVPWPWNVFSSHSPSYQSPFRYTIFPLPVRMSSSHSPSYLTNGPVHHSIVPFPSRLPTWKNPLYESPSRLGTG